MLVKVAHYTWLDVTGHALQYAISKKRVTVPELNRKLSFYHSSITSWLFIQVLIEDIEKCYDILKNLVQWKIPSINIK